MRGRDLAAEARRVMMLRLCADGVVADVANRRGEAEREAALCAAYDSDPRRGSAQGHPLWVGRDYAGKVMEMSRITPVVSGDDPYGEEAVA